MVDKYAILIYNIAEIDDVDIYSTNIKTNELFSGEWFSREFIHYAFIVSSLYIET